MNTEPEGLTKQSVWMEAAVSKQMGNVLPLHYKVAHFYKTVHSGQEAGRDIF